MLLHLLRHAHAGDPTAWTGPDEVRPLSDKGRGQADRLGRFLARIEFRPDIIVTSPKLRASETADIVAGHLDMTPTVDDRLAGGVDAAAVDDLLESLGHPERPVLVGHDPDFSELLASLCDADGVSMRKGAFARIEADWPLRAGGGQLRWLLPPDLLKPER